MFGSPPNIEGSMTIRLTAGFAYNAPVSGAFSMGEKYTDNIPENSNGGASGCPAVFDASKSSAIYSGTSLQVSALQTLVCIKS